MGTCVAKLPHEACGSRHGLQVFAQDDGTVNGYCYKCGTFVANPYGVPKKADELPVPVKKTPEQIAEEIKEIGGYQTVDIQARKLRAANLSQFGVKVALSEKDGKTPQAMFFPYYRGEELVAYKAKTIGLENNLQWVVGDGKDLDLFNWHNAKKSGAYRLIITEGEADAVAVDRIYELYGKDEYKPAVVSLPYGAGSARKSIQKHLNDIRRLFKEVVLSFDMDEKGRQAVKEVMLLLPDAKDAQLPAKDANDCIKQGVQKAAYKALQWDSAPPKHSSLIFGEAVHEEAKVQAEYGELSWPFASLNKKLRGIRYGETIYIGAG